METAKSILEILVGLTPLILAAISSWRSVAGGGKKKREDKLLSEARVCLEEAQRLEVESKAAGINSEPFKGLATRYIDRYLTILRQYDKLRSAQGSIERLGRVLGCFSLVSFFFAFVIILVVRFVPFINEDQPKVLISLVWLFLLYSALFFVFFVVVQIWVLLMKDTVNDNHILLRNELLSEYQDILGYTSAKFRVRTDVKRYFLQSEEERIEARADYRRAMKEIRALRKRARGK
ncbi:hypothetical protein FYJ24_09305 [Actinomycetaceae bacterium WB03_NA08]|uniref:Uncharacterized protein n=1 Tax=Scrofimicrobium canadense TaxID=2652290 RepID=A0A6N7W6Q9_9ACTO|nr:hypothetical protein [Scrofimicrobium canadense]MSS84955.1 hypothetical protein [Scrofimicrobium canadense]